MCLNELSLISYAISLLYSCCSHFSKEYNIATRVPVIFITLDGTIRFYHSRSSFSATDLSLIDNHNSVRLREHPSIQFVTQINT